MCILPLFLGVKWHVQSVCKFWGCRLSPYLRGETKTQESVDVRRCRLVPVLRAETSTVKNMEMCVCGSLVGGTPRQPKSSNFHTRGLSTICHFGRPPTLWILLEKCVNPCVWVASCLFSGQGRKT